MGAMDLLQSILATCDVQQVIDHFLDLKQQQKILFLVPTKALVKQQADYCRQNCRDVPGGSIAEVCGDWDCLFWWVLVYLVLSTCSFGSSFSCCCVGAGAYARVCVLVVVLVVVVVVVVLVLVLVFVLVLLLVLLVVVGLLLRLLFLFLLVLLLLLRFLCVLLLLLLLDCHQCLDR